MEKVSRVESSRVEGFLRRVSIKATGNPEPTVDLGAR